MATSSVRPSLVLSSQSPRRRQLLDAMGLPFRVVSVDCAEEHPDPDQVVRGVERNALLKASAASSSEGEIVLGADTLVVLPGRVLGKPKNTADAQEMLRSLSGRSHEVYTGLALRKADGTVRVSHAQSTIHFRELKADEIERYTATREPYDKAGSYAVQGLGMLFIDRIEGSYTNVMGLPLELLLVELEAISGIDRYRWFS